MLTTETELRWAVSQSENDCFGAWSDRNLSEYASNFGLKNKNSSKSQMYLDRTDMFEMRLVCIF